MAGPPKSLPNAVVLERIDRLDRTIVATRSYHYWLERAAEAKAIRETADSQHLMPLPILQLEKSVRDAAYFPAMPNRVPDRAELVHTSWALPRAKHSRATRRLAAS